MKSIRSRLTVTFIGLIAVILAVIWGVNKWYLEDFYVTKKVQALNGAYEAIDSRIEENKENGISIEDAMRREKDADGNITEGNLQRLIRNFSDSANVSVLIIDNSTEDATVYSTSRDTKFLKDRIDRYIFGGQRPSTRFWRKTTSIRSRRHTILSGRACTWRAGDSSPIIAPPLS